jgi:hypothetical protein
VNRRLAPLALVALLALALAAPAGAAPKPRFAKSVVLKHVSGTVFVQARGEKRRRRLHGTRRVRMPARVHATDGRVLVRSKLPSGKTQAASFNGAPFILTQPKHENGLTELKLDDNLPCGPGSVRAARRSRLFGSGHGRFRTRGRNSSATVRGTTWVTEDNCSGTAITSVKGEVQTNAEGADLSRLLDPGQTVTYYCTQSAKALPGSYCVLLLSDPANALFGMGIIDITDETQYQICITYPDGTGECGDIPFSDPEPKYGFRQSVLACFTRPGPGVYKVRWVVGGQTLFPQLETPEMAGADASYPPCQYATEPPAANRAPGHGGGVPRTGSHGPAALGLAPAFRPIAR